MPRRTPDQGVKPFEFRTGIGNLPALGGIYRAGDPATIPPNKLHLGVNIRITPGGMISRPGMAEQYNTGTAECIDGLVGPPGGSEPQPLLGLVVYPAGSGGWDADGSFGSDFVHPDALRPVVVSSLGLINEQPDADEEAYNPINLASPSDANEALYSLEPFLWRGKIHEFRRVTRTNQSGTDSTEWALVEYILPRKVGDTGTTKVLMYVGSTYDGETIQYCGGKAYTLYYGMSDYPDQVAGDPVGIFQRDDDQLSGNVQLREVLYFFIRGGTSKLHLMKFDGATMTEVGDYSGFWQYGASLCKSSRGGAWIFPNYRGFGGSGTPASLYHLNPDGSITTIDHDDTEIGVLGGERVCIGYTQSAGCDYFLCVGYDGNFDVTGCEILKVDTGFSWSLRLAYVDLNQRDVAYGWRRWNGRAFCGRPGGGVALLCGDFNLSAPGPEYYDFIYVDDPNDTDGFEIGVDDTLTLFSSSNWTQAGSIIQDFVYYGFAFNYHYWGPIWMTQVDQYFVIGGNWAWKDPLLNAECTGPYPGHAIYKLSPPTYTIDVVYESSRAGNYQTDDPFYPDAQDFWTNPSLGCLLTAAGQDDDEITTSLLGGV